jgi:hypothetical protein
MLPKMSLSLALMIAVPAFAAHFAPRVQQLAAWPPDSTALAARPVGRVAPSSGHHGWRYQWPGTYFEARCSGSSVFVDLGTGRKHARVSVDGAEVANLITADHPMLQIDGLTVREHQVRVDFVNESEAGVQTFGGFAAPAGGQLLTVPPRARTTRTAAG